ncbi:MAG: hypothetical protein IK001_05465 [Lachnospiraceae bacterium]|nr:hypothetical protein [Lachnospiraceae bacterium]
MNNETLRAAMDVFQILVLGYLIFRILRFLTKIHAKVGILYLAYGIMCLFFNDLYWLVHGLMFSDYRFPFGANEVSEIGFFLLFASALAFVFKDCKQNTRLEFTLTLIYAVISIGLWIGWSGEWAKDIITGIPFAYFCCQVVRSVRLSRAFRRVEWLFFAAFTFAIVFVECIMFFIPEPLYDILDTSCYFFLYSMLVSLICNAFIRTIRAKTAKDASAAVAMSALCMAWSLISMYMSLEPMYFFPQLGSAVAMILLTESYMLYTSLEGAGTVPDGKEAAV